MSDAADATERALWYHDRADEIRAVATSMPRGMARRGMIELAEDYETLARGLMLRSDNPQPLS